MLGNLAERYYDALKSIPAPGCGCHPALLGTSNLGVLAGLPADAIFQDIRKAIPSGHRRITDREITDAINKALSDHTGGSFIPRPRPAPIVRNGKLALQKIIDQGKISDEVDLWEASPLRLWEEPIHDPGLFLETLCEPNHLIRIGERHEPGIIGKTIRAAGDWITYFRNGGATAPHIAINPLNGIPSPTKVGDKNTLRGDSNVAEYRYCLVEFDNLSREDQIRFWSAVKLPIIALIDTGGKSIHAWIDIKNLVSVATAEQWQSEIKERCYNRLLVPLGVDAACSNPARLSRLPGHYRVEKRRRQRLLWLSPEGRTIC